MDGMLLFSGRAFDGFGASSEVGSGISILERGIFLYFYVSLFLKRVTHFYLYLFYLFMEKWN